MAKAPIRLVAAATRDSTDREISTLSVYKGSPEKIPPLGNDQYELLYRFVNDKDIHNLLQKSYYRDIGNSISTFLFMEVDSDPKFSMNCGATAQLFKFELARYLGEDTSLYKDHRTGVEVMDKVIENHSTLLRFLINKITDFQDDYKNWPTWDLRRALLSDLERSFIRNLYPSRTAVLEMMYDFSPARTWVEQSKYSRASTRQARLLYFVRPGGRFGTLYFAGVKPTILREIEAGLHDGILETEISNIVDVEKTANITDIHNYLIKLSYNFNESRAAPLPRLYLLHLAEYIGAIESNHGYALDPNLILNPALSPLERARMLDKYVREHPGEPISSIIVKAFVEPAEARSAEANVVPAGAQERTLLVEDDTFRPLPEIAPVKWKDREPGESAPDFASRVYGAWLKNGMSKRALRKLDAALVNELNIWVRNGNEMPSDLKLLTVKEENNRLLEGAPDVIREHLGKFTGQEALREATRIRSAQARRK